MKKKILFLNPTRRNELINYLRETLDVYIACNNPLDSCCLPTEKKVIIDHKDYVEIIINFCIKKGIHLVLPWLEKDIQYLWTVKKMLNENKIELILDDEKGARLSYDKLAVTERLVQSGINFMAEILIVEKIMSFPVVLKPKNGSGSVGVKIIQENSQLENFDKKKQILTKYYPGNEYTVDCFSFHGKATNIVPRKRMKQRSGEALIFVTENNDILKKHVMKICLELRLHGPVNIQFIDNGQGEYFCTDINPRIAGGITLSIASGVNYSKLLTQVYFEKRWSDEYEFKVKWNLAASRYSATIYCFMENHKNIEIENFDYFIHNETR